MASYRKIDQATVIILDIGENVSIAEEKNEKSFFKLARECAARVLERKIMAQTKELISIVLLGTKRTNNNMATDPKGPFRHITLLVELKTPTWDMIRDLPETTSQTRGDWIDSLIVAADHLKSGVSGYKISSKKIILMTNFQAPHCYSTECIDQLMNGLKEDELQLDIIGPDIYLDTHKGEDWQVARQLVEATNGATATFDFVQQYLLFHKKRAINPMPRNIDLSIGPNIRIPVSAFLRIRDEPAVKSWQKAVKDPVGASTPSFTDKGTIKSLNMASSTEGILRQRQHVDGDNQTVIPEDQLIPGYHYGQEIIPFPDNNNMMTYNSGHKCLSIYGFTNADSIQWQCLDSNGLSYVFGRKGDKKAQKALRCLVECLHEMNLVGVARSVYREGSAPQMFVLMPVIDTEDYICLSMIGICYKEKIKYMAFPSTKLKKYEHSNEQVNAFKDLIIAMDLTNAYDDSYDSKEAFPIAQTVSPTVQYVLDCIAYRALNPGKPLPQPRDDIMMLFKVPPLVEKRSREPLEKLKTLFTLLKVEKKIRGKKKAVNDALMNNVQNPDLPSSSDNLNSDFKFEMPKVQLGAKKTNVVQKIGTLNPISDFEALADKMSFIELSQQMSKAIEDLFYSNFDGIFSKALDTLKYFREKCVESDPTPYNEWLLKYKRDLMSRQKENVIKLIDEKHLGFIIKNENSKSMYEKPDSHDESQLYDNDTVPEMTNVTIPTEVEDMFADM